MSLEIEFNNDPLGFALKHPLMPGDEAEGYGKDMGDTYLVQNEGNFSEWRSIMIRPLQQKAMVRFTKSPVCAGGINVKGGLYGISEGQKGLPAYFLPWDDRGAVVRMTIPNKNTSLSEKRHPKLFFTACLSGCSVFFSGDQENPTIYHAGTGNAQRRPVGNNFYEELILRCRMGGHDKNTGRLRIMQKNAYLQQSHKWNRVNFHALELLEKKYKNMYVQESYSRMGCVFGFRIKDKWEFYLQRNVIVSLKTWDNLMRDVKRTKYWGLFKEVVKESYQDWGKVKHEMYPESVQKIYPGSGKVSILPDTVLVKL